MGAAKKIDQQIAHYLDQLTSKQKEAVLTVVKTFADIDNVMMETPEEYSTAFKAELDRRYTEYKSGKSRTIDPIERKKRIQKILKTNKKK